MKHTTTGVPILFREWAGWSLKPVRRRVEPIGMFRRRSTNVSERYTQLCADDLQVIAALESHGADLNSPRHVLHYVQVASRDVADRAARLGGRWLTTVTDPGAPGEGWFVIYERHDRVLTPVNIMADRSLFENMAEVHQGVYDGWEVSI